jgi:hypothetical protein
MQNDTDDAKNTSAEQKSMSDLLIRPTGSAPVDSYAADPLSIAAKI